MDTDDASTDDEIVDDADVDCLSADESSNGDARIEDTSVDESNDDDLSIDRSNVDESFVVFVVKGSSVDCSVRSSELDAASNDTETPPKASTGPVAHRPLGQNGIERCIQRPTLIPVSSETVSPIAKHDVAGPEPKAPSAV